jgi:hypothetical protein
MKAEQVDLDATNAVVATKASQADLNMTNAALAQKADPTPKARAWARQPPSSPATSPPYRRSRAPWATSTRE